jgi:hypothetical protein
MGIAFLKRIHVKCDKERFKNETLSVIFERLGISFNLKIPLILMRVRSL